MRCCTAAAIALLATTDLSAQQTSRQPGNDWTELDSGTVVRLHWKDGTEKARLLAPFGSDSSLVRYCRYPSPVCGTSTINPPKARPVGDLSLVEIRRGSRVGRGALVGAGVGAVGGLLIILGQGLSDQPAMSGSDQFLTVALTAAVWGGLGALVGSFLDNWQAVPH
jgi:hypothetical protein